MRITRGLRMRIRLERILRGFFSLELWIILTMSRVFDLGRARQTRFARTAAHGSRRSDSKRRMRSRMLVACGCCQAGRVLWYCTVF